MSDFRLDDRCRLWLLLLLFRFGDLECFDELKLRLELLPFFNKDLLLDDFLLLEPRRLSREDPLVGDLF